MVFLIICPLSQSGAFAEYYGHLIPTMQNDVAEMIDDLVMPVAVKLEKKVEAGS
jgi:hypothetical protein